MGVGMGWETPSPPSSPGGFWGRMRPHPEQVWESSWAALGRLGRLVPVVMVGAANPLSPQHPAASPPHPPATPRKPSVGSLGLRRAPTPQGNPNPMVPSPWDSPSPWGSPTSLIPWVPPAPQLPSCPAQSHLAPKGWGSPPPRANLGAQPRAGSGGKSQHPGQEHPSPAEQGLVPQFPSITRGGWLAGGGVRLPAGLQPSPRQLYGEMAALLGEAWWGAAAWQHTPSTGPQEKGIIFSVVSKEMRL